MDPSQMMPRSFPVWPPPTASDAMAMPPPPFLPPPNRGWKRKNPNSSGGGAPYQPPAVGDLQTQNRAKARRWFNPNTNRNRSFPNNKAAAKRRAAAAPRNTTSFIIRAKRAGGIAPLVSPCPVTPAVLPTPVISPSRDEGLLSDVLAQRQWGVDGYGSMKGLIRLRPHLSPNADDEEEDDSSGGSDVEEHVEVERRLDHDLSRFEMVYPDAGGRGEEGYVFEEEDDENEPPEYHDLSRRNDVRVHVAQLEEENMTLKERLFLVEQEVGDMRSRLEALEARFSRPAGGSGGNAAAAADVEAREDMDNVAAAGAERALDNGAEMYNANAAACSDNDAVEQALRNNGTERGDAASGAGNAVVEEALENGMEKTEKSVEEDSADMAGVGSEKNAEISDARSAQDNGEESKQA